MQENDLIRDKNTLIEYMESGCKPKTEWRIGTEHEKFTYHLSDLSQLEYEGERGIRALLEGMTKFGWDPVIENGKTIDQIRMIGGNIGPTIGGQSYSQITYIMDTETFFQIQNGQKFSLQGTATYAKSGQSVTDIFGQISDGQNLVTIIFNQSGYLAGISFEGTYIARKNE